MEDWSWQCPACTYANDVACHRCSMCEQPRPLRDIPTSTEWTQGHYPELGAGPSQHTDNSFPALGAPVATASEDPDEAAAQPEAEEAGDDSVAAWQCGSCTFFNVTASNPSDCSMCSTPRPVARTTSSGDSGASGQRAPAWSFPFSSSPTSKTRGASSPGATPAEGGDEEAEPSSPSLAAQSEGAGEGDEAAEDDWRCAICMNGADELDEDTVAAIRPCLHSFWYEEDGHAPAFDLLRASCLPPHALALLPPPPFSFPPSAPCIVRWSTGKETAKCPLCQTPFTNVMVRRRLDGVPYASGEWGCESVILLARAEWVQQLDQSSTGFGSRGRAGAADAYGSLDPADDDAEDIASGMYDDDGYEGHDDFADVVLGGKYAGGKGFRRAAASLNGGKGASLGAGGAGGGAGRAPMPGKVFNVRKLGKNGQIATGWPRVARPAPPTLSSGKHPAAVAFAAASGGDLSGDGDLKKPSSCRVQFDLDEEGCVEEGGLKGEEEEEEEEGGKKIQSPCSEEAAGLEGDYLDAKVLSEGCESQKGWLAQSPSSSASSPAASLMKAQRNRVKQLRKREKRREATEAMQLKYTLQ